MKTTNSGWELHPSSSADLEPTNITSPVVYPTTLMDTTVFTSVPDSSETVKTEAEVTSTTTPSEETSSSQQTSSTTQIMTILSGVSSETIPKMFRTDVISSIVTSSPGSVETTTAPELTSRLSTSPTKAEPVEMANTTPPDASVFSSRDSLNLGTQTTVTEADTDSPVTQSPPSTEMVTAKITSSEGVSWTKPSSEGQTIISSSLMPSSPMISPSPVFSTLLGTSPSSEATVTSLLTPGLKTTHMEATSLEPGSTSPSWSITRVEAFTAPDGTTDTESDHLSENTTVDKVGTSPSGEASQSSVLMDSASSKASYAVGKSSTSGATTVSTAVPFSSETANIATEPIFTLSTTGETGSSQKSSLTTTITTVLSEVSPETTMEEFTTNVISSIKTSSSGSDQTTETQEFHTESTSRLTTSPIMVETPDTVNPTPMDSSEPSSLSSRNFDASAMYTQARTDSTKVQSVSHAEVNAVKSTSSEDVSWTKSLSVENANTTSILESSPTVTSASPVSPILPWNSTSAETSVISHLTTGLAHTTDVVRTSFGPLTLSHTTLEVHTASEATTETEPAHFSQDAALSNVKTTMSGQESHSLVLGDTEPSKATSPGVISSTNVTTTFSTSTPFSDGTSKIMPESTSALGHRDETDDSQQSSPTTGITTVHYEMPTITLTEKFTTDVLSPPGTTIPVPAQSTVSPEFFTGLSTGLYSFPVEPTEMSTTTQTAFSEATSQEGLTLDTFTTASWVDTDSSVTRSFTHSEMTSVESTRPETVSWTKLSSEEITETPSSLVSSAVTTPSFTVSSLLPESNPTSLSSVSSIFSPSLIKTTSNSLQNLSSTTVDAFSISEMATDTRTTHLSQNTPLNTMVATTSGEETYSSVTFHSEPSETPSPLGISSTNKAILVSASIPFSSETSTIESEPTSTLSHTEETGSSQQTSFTTETITVFSEVISSTTTEILRTDAISSRGMSISGSDKYTTSSEFLTKLFTSPILMELTDTTSIPQVDDSGATSQSLLSRDTSATITLADIDSTVTQGFSHSTNTTVKSQSSETVAPTKLFSVEEISTFLPESSPVMTSSSSVPSTLPGSSFSSVALTTLPVTSGPVRMTDMDDTSLRPATTSHPKLSSTTTEENNTTEAIAKTETVHLSQSTAVNKVGTTTSGQEEYSFSRETEPSKSSFPVVSSTTNGEATIFTSIPSSSETRTQSMSTFLPSISEETSDSKQTSSTTETMRVLSQVPPGATPEAFKTELVSSDLTLIPSPTQSTVSTDVSTRLSTSPIMSKPTEMNSTTSMDSSGSAALGPFSSTSPFSDSTTGTVSSVTQNWTHRERSTIKSTSSETASWTEPPTVEETSALSTLVSSPEMTFSSPVSSTFSESSPASSTTMISIFTPDLVNITDMVDPSLRHETSSSSPSLKGTTMEILMSLQSTTHAESAHVSQNTDVNNLETTHSGQEHHSSFPVDSESSKATSLMVSSTTNRVSTLPTSVPGFFEMSKTKVESPSTQETSTVLSHMPTGTTPETSSTNIISSSGISSTGAEATVFPEVTTRHYASAIITEPTDMINTPSPFLGTTSKHFHGLATSVTESWTETDSFVSSPHSEMASVQSTSSEAISSWTQLVSVEETNAPSFLVPTLDMTTDVITSRGMSISDSDKYTTSPEFPTGFPGTKLFTSPILVELTDTTSIPPVDDSGATSQILFSRDTSATATLANTDSTVTQGFPQPTRTIVKSTISEIVTSTKLFTVENTTPFPMSLLPQSSPSSTTVMSLVTPAPVKTTDMGHTTSSPPDLNSPTTEVLSVSETTVFTSEVKTSDTVGPRLSPGSSFPPNSSSPTTEVVTISGATTGEQYLHFPSVTVVSNMETTSSGQESHTFVSADLETLQTTPPTISLTTNRDTTYSTSMSHSSEAGKVDRESSLRLNATDKTSSSTTEHFTTLSDVPTATVTETLKTELISSGGVAIPTSSQSTLTPDFSTGFTAGLSISHITVEPSQVTTTKQAGFTGSQISFLLGTSTTHSSTETHSAMTLNLAQSERTSVKSSGSEDVSWTKPSSREETSTPSFLLSSPPMTPAHSPKSFLPSSTTFSTNSASIFTSDLVTTSGGSGTSLGPGANLSPLPSSSLIKVPTISESSTNTGDTHSATHLAVTSSSGPEIHSSVPVHSDLSNGTVLSLEDTTIPTSTPTSFETERSTFTNFNANPLLNLLSY
ncbi:mucin-16-like [Erinaceus europaeus]|uniref:Mucin-16-like n=1 Tax=Erinaceus europaeus TaxID=9365 RepID=A0ABM3WTV0_ERIEU|nr:mucin-16-like [Erinaceus europaeus]